MEKCHHILCFSIKTDIFHGQTTVFKDIRPDETDISASDAHTSGKYLRIYENVAEKRLHLYD